MDNTCKRCNRPIIFSEGTTQQYHVMCRQRSATDRNREREKAKAIKRRKLTVTL